MFAEILRFIGRKSRVVSMLILILLGHGFGTAVLVVEINGVVYLATDGQLKDANTGRTWSECKIFKVGPMYTAYASNFYKYRYTGLDIAAIVDSVGTKGTVTAKMDRFVKAVVPPLQRAISHAMKHDPARYAALGNAAPLQIVFLQLESGRPFYEFASFAPRIVGDQLTINTVRIPRANPSPNQPFSGAGLGVYEGVLAYLDAHAQMFPLDPVGTILAGLQEQARADQRIGPPYSILRLDAKGPQWMEKGICK